MNLFNIILAMINIFINNVYFKYITLIVYFYRCLTGSRLASDGTSYILYKRYKIVH